MGQKQNIPSKSETDEEHHFYSANDLSDDDDEFQEFATMITTHKLEDIFNKIKEYWSNGSVFITGYKFITRHDQRLLMDSGFHVDGSKTKKFPYTYTYTITWDCKILFPEF